MSSVSCGPLQVSFQLQFLLYTDASDSAIGAVLSRMKKFTSFWRGPYTVIDQLNAAIIAFSWLVQRRC